MDLLVYHGAPVILLSKPAARGDGLVILADCGPEYVERYVTWSLNSPGGYRYWGHYFESLEEAEFDFATRRN
jgi:hypothetical protein